MANTSENTLTELGYRTINNERRAEIGAARRAKSRNTILTAAFECFGHEAGLTSRIEDICKTAGIARGTFYNHFDDLQELKYQLQEELTGEFDRAVHLMFEGLDGPAEQTAVAIRYYLRAAEGNPAWGWAMIHSSAPGHTFGDTVWHNSLVTIRRGLDAGIFNISSAEIGRDILMGSVAAAMVSITQGCTPPSYAEQISEHILLAFGMSAAQAHDFSNRPLPTLPDIALEKIVIASMPALGDIGDIGDAGPKPKA
ncbi:TetR/AcrR family transcriptional regulator [Celeribacter baekdonensis]|uniref:TetR family transcriptional regulator n=1 Tax=Celeribacter baekdonensis TaxID=875171 RepID=A0A2R4M4S6_9RHOB|nr:TetR/AcrR family transcriptional regulator [Celeribacter baekdonensis]AVW92156.1 TetR family transcriptional regulator [Celeribacter baekdonensis]